MKPKNILFLASFAPGADDAEHDYERYRAMVEPYHSYVFDVLEAFGFNVIPSRNPLSIVSKRDQVDFVFNLMNCFAYHSKSVVAQALCEASGLPFQGADAIKQAFDTDKVQGKMLARQAGVETADWISAMSLADASELHDFAFPGIVKPRFSSNSEGIEEHSVVQTADDAVQRARELANRNLSGFIERFIPGYDVTVGTVGSGKNVIVGDPIMINSDGPWNIQTFSHKSDGVAVRHKSLVTDENVIDEVQEAIRRLYRAIGGWDYARIDFRVDETSKRAIFLELNLLPNLDPMGMYVQSLVGEPKYGPEVIRAILTMSFNRQGLMTPWPVSRIRNILRRPEAA